MKTRTKAWQKTRTFWGQPFWGNPFDIPKLNKNDTHPSFNQIFSFNYPWFFKRYPPTSIFPHFFNQPFCVVFGATCFHSPLGFVWSAKNHRKLLDQGVSSDLSSSVADWRPTTIPTAAKARSRSRTSTKKHRKKQHVCLRWANWREIQSSQNVHIRIAKEYLPGVVFQGNWQYAIHAQWVESFLPNMSIVHVASE